MAEAADDQFPVYERLPGEMAGRVHGMDWSQTPIGPMDGWSSGLRHAVQILLGAGFPMALRWGPEFILIYNDAYRQILGDRHPAALGRPARLVWPEIWPRMEAVHHAILSGESDGTFAADATMRVRRNGDRWEEARFTLAYSPLPDETTSSGVGGVLAMGVETTLQAQAERDLVQEVEQRTHERNLLWQNSQDLLLVLDTKGECLAVNPAWTAILGWQPEEIIGRNFLEFVHPDDRPRSGKAFTHVTRDAMPSFDIRYSHKNGGWRWISWVAAPDQHLVYASGRHVTAEKESQADLAATREALRQAQKMEAIGQLTGGIAHDFNNMLAIVIGSLDIAERRLKRGDTHIERYLENAQEGAARASILTKRLLAFARRSPLSPQVIGLNMLVADMSDLLRRTLGERIRLETALADDLWLAHADPNQLESAIVNLAVNARDAMPDGGGLIIETANVHLDAAYIARETGITAGQYILLAVSDAGVGIAPELIDRVFDPFFTTKPVGKGTGLGLSMVYGFARQSGGHVRIYSEPGQGTTVKIYLPRHAGAPEAPAAGPVPILPATAAVNETVLLVEDEDRVRRMSTDALRELGYTVHTAASGEEALALFGTIDRVDILFTDVMMGGMTGRELADALRVEVPDLKVLYTTGYTRNAIVHNGMLDPGVALLGKPFSVADLALKLRAVLDG